MENELVRKENKAHKFMIGLVYPSVLGSIIFH